MNFKSKVIRQGLKPSLISEIKSGIFTSIPTCKKLYRIFFRIVLEHINLFTPETKMRECSRLEGTIL